MPKQNTDSEKQPSADVTESPLTPEDVESFLKAFENQLLPYFNWAAQRLLGHSQSSPASDNASRKKEEVIKKIEKLGEILSQDPFTEEEMINELADKTPFITDHSFEKWQLEPTLTKIYDAQIQALKKSQTEERETLIAKKERMQKACKFITNQMAIRDTVLACTMSDYELKLGRSEWTLRHQICEANADCYQLYNWKNPGQLYHSANKELAWSGQIYSTLGRLTLDYDMANKVWSVYLDTRNQLMKAFARLDYEFRRVQRAVQERGEKSFEPLKLKEEEKTILNACWRNFTAVAKDCRTFYAMTSMLKNANKKELSALLPVVTAISKTSDCIETFWRSHQCFLIMAKHAVKQSGENFELRKKLATEIRSDLWNPGSYTSDLHNEIYRDKPQDVKQEWKERMLLLTEAMATNDYFHDAINPSSASLQALAADRENAKEGWKLATACARAFSDAHDQSIPLAKMLSELKEKHPAIDTSKEVKASKKVDPSSIVDTPKKVDAPPKADPASTVDTPSESEIATPRKIDALLEDDASQKVDNPPLNKNARSPEEEFTLRPEFNLPPGERPYLVSLDALLQKLDTPRATVSTVDTGLLDSIDEKTAGELSRLEKEKSLEPSRPQHRPIGELNEKFILDHIPENIRINVRKAFDALKKDLDKTPQLQGMQTSLGTRTYVHYNEGNVAFIGAPPNPQANPVMLVITDPKLIKEIPVKGKTLKSEAVSLIEKSQRNAPAKATGERALSPKKGI